MLDSISTQYFCKQFVCKMASLITNDCPWGSLSTKDISLKKPYNCIKIIFGTNYDFHPFGHIIHSKENVNPNEGEKGPMKSIPRT